MANGQSTSNLPRRQPLHQLRLNRKTEGHHIRPLAKGGAAYDSGNIVTLCAACHRQKKTVGR